MPEQPPDLTPEMVGFGPLSAPMVTAARAARQVIAGKAPNDELSDTQVALAASFALEHQDILKYEHRTGRWLICDPVSHVWRYDETGEHTRLLQSFLETQVFDQAALAASRHDLNALRAVAKKSLSAHGVRDVRELTKHQEGIACAGDEWDRDPWVIADAAGTLVDLRNGGRRPLRPNDRIRRACAVQIDTAARCDRFRKFVTEICNGDDELVKLLTASLGYSLTGDISEQVFFVAVGAGANGKSTLLELVAYILGYLSGLLPFSTLMRDRNTGAVQAEVADLPGTRFVRASEVREGAHLDEGRIKSLTGGDPISAARKFGHPFTFRPEFKLWLGVNHRPRVSDRSHGFWRRAVLIPFSRTFPGDKRLEQQLRDEAPGILAWLVEAALDWQREGLPRPAASEDARRSWRETEDVIGQWASCSLVADEASQIGAADAFKAFSAWADAQGLSDRERPNHRTFGEWMASHFKGRKTRTGRFYEARLASVTDDGSDGQDAAEQNASSHGSDGNRHEPSPSPLPPPGELLANRHEPSPNAEGVTDDGCDTSNQILPYTRASEEVGETTTTNHHPSRPDGVDRVRL